MYCFDGRDINAPGEDNPHALQGSAWCSNTRSINSETVYKDIAFGSQKHGAGRGGRDQRVRGAMDTVGLIYDEIKDRSPSCPAGRCAG